VSSTVSKGDFVKQFVVHSSPNMSAMSLGA
jgi:hypothetical protein